MKSHIRVYYHNGYHWYGLRVGNRIHLLCKLPNQDPHITEIYRIPDR